MTQNEMVLEYLNDVGHITPLDAMREFGIMRLGARIWDLKREGHDIIAETESSTNRYGKKVSYARYKMNAGSHRQEEG